MDEGTIKIISRYIVYLKMSNLVFDKVYLWGSNAKKK
jgi:hypothetical protein